MCIHCLYPVCCLGERHLAQSAIVILF